MKHRDTLSLAPYLDDLSGWDLIRWTGQVTEMVGLVVESRGPAVAVGDFCEIATASGRTLRCQVIGFRNGRVLSMPLEEPVGVQLGDRIVARNESALVGVGPGLLGRVLDGFGRPMDNGSRLEADDHYPLLAPPPSPLEREHIVEPLATGIRTIDGLLPCGRGQRIGLFGGSGVGKSTLLSAMARNHSADVSVIALIGERNREVRDFIDRDLGPEGLKRSVVVVATSDQPAPLRVRACYVALTVAEYFRDQGKSVLLVMDSVTRLAMAQREIGLASGEPPSQKGYTPSVFSLLPKIFERAGNFKQGSITGFFTVLVEGDDFNEPICDAVRSILDGHIVLSRQLQSAGHYPAIDVLSSVSRLSARVASTEQQKAASKVREALAVYQRAEDLIQIGAHVRGADPKLDASIQQREQILRFLRQDSHEQAKPEETWNGLQSLASALP
ncbi:MAG: FliI/YscN family ATPase [Acidobacteria bacterium]|nr:FliI/YscN family ATPase [Acidobacteriota bacterium]MBI3471997.1 FliI/YscN family ATPase [Candidatus Solibacter usitatus]